MDPLDVFKQMKAAPEGKEGEKNLEEKNKEYADETYENFDLAKQMVAESLYGIKQNKEIQDTIDDTNNTIEEIDNIGTIENSPIFPVLKGLLDAGHIDIDSFNKTIENLKSNDKTESLDIVLNVIDNKELKEKIESQFKQTDKITTDNFEESDFFKDSKSLDLDKATGNLEVMLANNYINIPNIEGKDNTNQSIEASIETTLNTIIEKQSPLFIKQNAILIGEIRSEPDLNNKYSKLKELYKQDLLDDAKKGGKKAKLEIELKNKNLKKEVEKLKKYIKEQFTKNPEKKEELEQYYNKQISKLQKKWGDNDLFEKEINKIEKEIKETQGIFNSGENDKEPTTLTNKQPVTSTNDPLGELPNNW